MIDNKAPSMLGNEISCLLLLLARSAFFPPWLSEKTRESEQEEHEAATKDGEITERLQRRNETGRLAEGE